MSEEGPDDFSNNDNDNFYIIKVLRKFLSLGSIYIDPVKLDTDGPSIGSSSYVAYIVVPGLVIENHYL